jgi:plastocyanin
MMKHIFALAKKQLAIGVGMMVFLMPVKMFATTHIVHFGGSLGLVFSPDSFSAHVGDTVTWRGDFSMHNTVSESIPSGAASWNFGLNSDTTFSYAIKVAGAYHYECTIHVAYGMVGVFTVTAATGIRSSYLPSNGENTIAVHALSLPGRVTLLLNLPEAEVVSYKIVNVAGRQLRAGDSRKFKAGVNAIDVTAIPDGIYLIRLIANGAEIKNTFSIRR